MKTSKIHLMAFVKKKSNNQHIVLMRPSQRAEAITQCFANSVTDHEENNKT